MGIQAFEPVLVEGNAIQLAPAGLQGLQRRLRRRPDGRPPAAVDRSPGRSPHADDVARNNIFSPANGNADHQPVAGHGDGLLLHDADRCRTARAKAWSSRRSDEVHLAYSLGKIDTHARIKVRLPTNRQRLKSERTTIAQARRDDRHHRRPRAVQRRSCPSGMAFYNIRMRSSESGQGDFRLLPDPWPPRHDRLARRHEADRLPREQRAAACRSPPTI